MRRFNDIYLFLHVARYGSFTAAAADSWAMLTLGRALQGAGAVSADMVASILDAVNGHPIRGLARALVGYVANARADRATQRQIDRRR